MSTNIVKIVRIDEIKEHPNADRLELVKANGWWVVAQKGNNNIGDKRIYIQPDSLVPERWAKEWEIDKYCTPINGKYRVRAAKIRGIASFGCLIPIIFSDFEIGQDVSEVFDITKYEPPDKIGQYEYIPDYPNFFKYTNIEHLNNYPTTFSDGEIVVIEEKIHGTNCRIGYITHNGEQIITCGSHESTIKLDSSTIYNYPYIFEPQLKYLLQELSSFDKRDVIVFFELFGENIQDMKYGSNYTVSFRAFDICVDGVYLDYNTRTHVLGRYNISTPPALYIGPYSEKIVQEYSTGNTKVCDVEDIKENFKGREGIIIRPLHETFSEVLRGRKIAKVINIDYYTRANANPTERH